MNPSRPNPNAANSTSGRAGFSPGGVADLERAERGAAGLDDQHRHDEEQAAGRHERAAPVVQAFERRDVQHVVAREEHEAHREEPDDPSDQYTHAGSVWPGSGGCAGMRQWVAGIAGTVDWAPDADTRNAPTTPRARHGERERCSRHDPGRGRRRRWWRPAPSSWSSLRIGREPGAAIRPPSGSTSPTAVRALVATSAWVSSTVRPARGDRALRAAEQQGPGAGTREGGRADVLVADALEGDEAGLGERVEHVGLPRDGSPLGQPPARARRSLRCAAPCRCGWSLPARCGARRRSCRPHRGSTGSRATGSRAPAHPRPAAAAPGP